MKLETLKLRPDFIGQAYYERQETAPKSVFGQAGNFTRHVLGNEKHGVFHVITPASAEVYPTDTVVELVNPVFYEDYGVNGRSVAPCLNVYADGLKVVKGG